MNQRLLFLVTAPGVVVGVILIGLCLVTAWYVNRLQTNLTEILANNVGSMQAAQELEITVRHMRFRCFLYLIASDPLLLQDIREDQKVFKRQVEVADAMAVIPAERQCVEDIRKGFSKFEKEFERLRNQVEKAGPRLDFRALADAHPIRHVIEPCREYLRINEEMMKALSLESSAVTQRLHLTVLLLGLGGPIGGLLGGWTIARGLSRTLYRLSVRVQDMAQQLDRDVTAVHLSADGDLEHLERQLQEMVGRVAEVTQNLQQHQNEMLRAQQLAAVGQLAASVAHEVRNPLASIKLLIEASMRPQRPRPLTPESVQVMHGEILKLEKTVQGFLDFARPPRMERRACDLRELIQQALALVRTRAQQQRVQLEARCPDAPVLGQVDPNQLCNVLVNLFFNALDAMPRGGRLVVQLQSQQPEGIRLEVLDTGSGIPSRVQELMFTPFFSTKPTGSGLGLSISRRIILEHGGDLTAANRPAGGACFTIRLPLKTPEGSAVVSDEPSAPPAA